MYEIPIYEAEKASGLTEIIRANASVAFASLAELTTKFSIPEKTVIKAKSFAPAKAAAEDFDLHYLKTILVSTGWNKNDDVFDPLEVWAARATPEDKPFNFEHDCSQIIGHITSNYVVDEEQKLVADDSTVDTLPAKFHVVTGAVLYKYWEKEDLQKRMDDILTAVADGKKFVSMEALFKGFDYALVDKAGAARVVARNQETAFLTKHLRVYGGTGVYKDLKVGRILRNIVFSGKGLVEKPANPESVILAEAQTFTFAKEKYLDISHALANLGYSTVTSNTERKFKMNELELLQKQFTELKAENEKLAATLRDNDVKQVQAKLEAVAAEKLKADELLKVADATIKSEKSLREKAEADKATVVAEAEKTAAELTLIKAEQKKNVRIAYVMKQLKFEDVKAAEYVATLETLSDEAFAKNIDGLVAFAVSTNPQSGNTTFPHKEVKEAPKGTPAPLPPKATSLPAPMAGKASETDPAEVIADPANLQTVEVEKTAALATEAVDAGVDKVRADIATYFGFSDSK